LRVIESAQGLAGVVLLGAVQQRIGVFVAALVVLGWLVYIVVNLRHRDETAPPGSEIELAPNRKPYYDDDALEGRRLERVLGWGLIVMVVCAVGPLVYWLREPSRQAGAERGFQIRAEERGHSLFQPTDSPEHGAHFGCATCHGSVGQGGVTRYSITDYLGRTRQVQWAAPPVDTALLKFSKEEVRTILEYGRPNSPMPAWGVKGGGPMNDQQLDDLVAYMESITITPEKARERSLAEALDEARRLGKVTPDMAFPALAVDGESLFGANCARCHTKGWSYGEPEAMGGGAFGPNLTNGLTLRQFPDRAEMIEFITDGSEYGEPYGVRGVGGDEGGGMPGFGRVLTEAQILAIVDYVRNL
jgi:mono/diheme cytochrome c family protein